MRLRGLKLQVSKKRAAAIAIIAILNAALFFTIGCAALCVFASCPQTVRRASGEGCHHKCNLPAKQGDGHQESSCPNHSFPMASLVLQAAPDITPILQNSHSSLSLVQLIFRVIPQSISDRNILSPSPPGISTGRIVCQRYSLLRI